MRLRCLAKLLWLLSVVLPLGACDEPAPGGAASSATAAADTATSAPPKTRATASSSATLPPLLNPKAATAKAPDKFQTKFETTKGDFVVEVTRDWAPRGADRFYNLVKIGFFTDMALFRVVKGFVVQFGLHGDPKVSAAWREAYLMDELVKESNRRGTLTYAKRSGDTRTTQVFINLQDNTDLDDKGFSPFGKIVKGLKVIESFYSDYGERPSMGGGQQQVLQHGNAWLKKKYPKLDYIERATILP